LKRAIYALLVLIDNINEWTGNIVAYLLIPMTCIVSYEVVARYYFNAPTIWTMEMSEYLLVALGALGGGYTLLNRGHVNVDVVYIRMSERQRAIVDCITFCLFFAFIVAFVWQSWEAAIKALRIRGYSPSFWGPPVYPIKALLPIGAFLLLLQGVAKFIRDLAFAIKGEHIFDKTEEVAERTGRASKNL